MDKITDGMWIAASILIVGMTYTFGVAKPYYHADNCAALVGASRSANTTVGWIKLNECIKNGSAARYLSLGDGDGND